MRTVDARTDTDRLDREECLRLLAVLTEPVRPDGEEVAERLSGVLGCAVCDEPIGLIELRAQGPTSGVRASAMRSLAPRDDPDAPLGIGAISFATVPTRNAPLAMQRETAATLAHRTTGCTSSPTAGSMVLVKWTPRESSTHRSVFQVRRPDPSGVGRLAGRAEDLAEGGRSRAITEPWDPSAQPTLSPQRWPRRIRASSSSSAIGPTSSRSRSTSASSTFGHEKRGKRSAIERWSSTAVSLLTCTWA